MNTHNRLYALLLCGLALLVLLVAGVFGFGMAIQQRIIISVSSIMHNFWALDGIERIAEMHAFLGNLALLGSAFMFLAIPRPWPFSLDNGVDLVDVVLRRPRATDAARSDSRLNSHNS